VERILLYGSYAEGTQREGSDIDLVVISRDLGRFKPLERLEYLSKISWSIPAPLEIVGYTPEELEGKAGNSIFWDEILRTGRELYHAA
jgi:predicted nucleotidyltransferase